jgi:hypothetical protein
LNGQQYCDLLDGLGLKADEKLAGFIHIGTPSKPAEDRPPAVRDRGAKPRHDRPVLLCMGLFS